MSKNHDRIEPKRWARVRKQALERAGYRSEKSGLRGKLEVDHIVPIDRGGAVYDMDNVQVLTRTEHIDKTAAENRREPSPEEKEWADYLSKMIEGK